jgi:RNA polymerase sigma-70 factor (ECF subfamily)
MEPAAQSSVSWAWEAGRARWGAWLSHDDFAAYVLELRERGAAPSDGDLRERAADLFLAAACVAAIPRALAAFERELMSQVPEMVAVIDPSYGFGTDVAQALRERLLLPPLERLRHYSGAGSLTGWLRVAARRIAVDLKRREGASLRRAERLPAAMASRSPEWELVRNRYQGPLEEALRAAIDDLPSRDRMVLRLYLLRRENIDGIGRIYGVHRATVARWISAAQQAIVAAVLARLQTELGLSPAEFESLVHDLRSQLEITLSSVL